MANSGWRYVGVGIDEYADFEPLTRAVTDVRELGRILHPIFVGTPACNSTANEVRDYLTTVADDTVASLVLSWNGHGKLSGGRLLLATRNAGGVISVEDVIDSCVSSGARQLLFIIDTCHAGASIADVHSIASQFLAECPPEGDRVWFGILVSSTATGSARDGVFGTLLRKLLTVGPDSPELRRRWSAHNRLIVADDLADALKSEWTEPDHEPDFLSRGFREPLLPNPLWDPGAGQGVVEHLLTAARGGALPGERSWFTGREHELREIVDYVRSGRTGVYAVTGAAGVGKSALVGRIISLADKAERQRLMANWEPWDRHAEPGAGSVHAHVHLRGLDTERAAEQIDGRLVSSGVLRPAEEGRRNAAELIGAVQRVANQRQSPPVIVADGLDEAREHASLIAQDLLLSLARYATVVVATRDIQGSDRVESLLATLHPNATLDLDRSADHSIVQRYIQRRLTGAALNMDPAAVADHLTQFTETSFLLARIVVDQLLANPVDTNAPNWQRHVAHSVQTAFDLDLERISAPGIRLPPGVPARALARIMLFALTHAFGAGFPEEVWLDAAGKLVGGELDREHIGWLLDSMGRYIVQDGEDGVATYRLAHASLADYLMIQEEPSQRGSDEAAAAVWAAVDDRYKNLRQRGLPPEASPYLRNYARRHAAAAGVPGLARLRRMADEDDRFTADLAQSALDVAWVDHDSKNLPATLPVAEEAVQLFGRLAPAGHLERAGLARSLRVLSGYYQRLDRDAEAVVTMQAAIDLYSSLSADNEMHQLNLAQALEELGTLHLAAHRCGEAATAVARAMEIYRNLAAGNRLDATTSPERPTPMPSS